MIGLTVAVLSVLSGAAIYIGNKIAAQAKALGAVKHQVENDHETNLRDDVTLLLMQSSDIQRNQSMMSAELASVRDDLRSGFSRTDKQHGETHKVITQEVEDRQALERRVGRIEQKV